MDSSRVVDLARDGRDVPADILCVGHVIYGVIGASLRCYCCGIV